MTRLWTAWVRIIEFVMAYTRVVLVIAAQLLFVCTILGPLEKGQVRNEALRELRVELTKKHTAGELDGFTLYL